jgi:hypothetical protein
MREHWLLGGAWAALAEPLAQATGVAVVILNPPAPKSGQDTVSPIYASRSLPTGGATLRGALLDADPAVAAESITKAMRERGRLAAPVTVAVPNCASAAHLRRGTTK